MGQNLLDRLAKTLGVRNQPKTGTSDLSRPVTTGKVITPPKPRINVSGTKQEGQYNATRDAQDERNYFYRASEERRKARLLALSSGNKGVRKYFETLAKIEPDCECTGYLDCDVDLRDLAERCNLPELPDVSDRFLLWRETHEWVIGLAKRRGVTRADYWQYADLFLPDDPTLAMVDLKLALRLH